jgi:hypothetical protein
MSHAGGIPVVHGGEDVKEITSVQTRAPGTEHGSQTSQLVRMT